MKKMIIFEPALCCETGVCGVGVDPELLRISTVLNSLKKNNVIVDRFNLNVAPMEFITNQIINKYLNEKGVEGLPAVIVDNEIIITGRYPTNDEFMSLLSVPADFLTASKAENSQEESSCCQSEEKQEESSCGCRDNKCC